MTPEEVEALDLKPGQRIELVMNTAIGYNKQPLPENQTYTKLGYYHGIFKSRNGVDRLGYYISNGRGCNPNAPIEHSVILDLINKIDHLERI